MRGPQKQHTYSKAMCYVSLDRAIKLARQFHVNAPHLQHWHSTKQEIFEEFTREGYKAELPGFAQSYDSTATDAALLRLPLFGVLPVEDPRISATIALVEKRLLKNGLLYRYRINDDGTHSNEGTFTACSFWLIENYVLQNRLDEAKKMFGYVLSHASDLGLLSEEIDPENGELLGNYPQGSRTSG
jgi:GH15 family glucan-1,4-alpha-glucosidase